MKRLITGLALLLASSLAAGANASFGSHGMVLFGGKQGLYASHLPMFHAPHDYQVVLRIRLADTGQDAALRAQLERKPALWTLDPEQFELDRFAPNAATPLTHFRADLVQGHFEQGGVTRYQRAAVIVEQVLLFRQLSAASAQADALHYLQLGSGTRRFLLKQVDSRPDFDHIVAISATPGVPTAPLSMRRHALAAPAAKALQQALPGTHVIAIIYLSGDDLK